MKQRSSNFLKPQIFIFGIFITLSLILFVSSIIYANSTSSPELPESVLSIEISPTIQPSNTPQPTPTEIPLSEVKSEIKQNEFVQTHLPSPTQIPTTVPTLQPTVTPIKEIVSVRIQTPDDSLEFNVNWIEDMDACTVLVQAELEGRLDSLTLDESYVKSFGSPYIYEINGYKDFWTFSVNGVHPVGCAATNINPNDLVVFRYG